MGRLNFNLGSRFKSLANRFMAKALKILYWIFRSSRTARSGFVLPTAILLILMVSLTVGALSFRSFTRTSQTIAYKDQQIVDSIAAPAIDRAKAKLEYLFGNDRRFPGGVPSSDVLASMLDNDNNNGIPQLTTDPYTLPDETKLNLNNGTTYNSLANPLDTAWSFTKDLDGDGTNETVVYSILMDDAAGSGANAVTLDSNVNATKAKALVARSGPINTLETAANCGSARSPEGGWQVIDSARLEKNFQIDVLVVSGNNVTRTVSAAEFQQVRRADRGNKWGAWFRNDLEIFPGASFRWNGAMHTEGSFIAHDLFVGRKISSQRSCLYSQDASEITMAENDAGYQGQAVFGRMSFNKFGLSNGSEGSKPEFHLFNGNGVQPTTGQSFERNNDSVLPDDGTNTYLDSIALDPIRLFTEDVSAHKVASSPTTWSRDSAWPTENVVTKGRIFNENTQRPYVDDGYRADNRYGPKPVYDSQNAIPSGSTIGQPIVSNVALTDASAGLDGYWERQAIDRGLRFIVGQRLELGNTLGWKANDPLYPVNNATVTNEKRQRRTLRDNLAAVQGMVVYHHTSSDGLYPLACIANTAHPGTATTLINSRTFNTYPAAFYAAGAAPLRFNFLEGQGTNGWEFDFYTEADFATDIASTANLGKALRNLANFAGDPEGGSPSFPPVQGKEGVAASDFVHPFPYLSMWGDFSILRRIFTEYLDAPTPTTYTNLSPADKSTLHSAACTLGLLAYSVDQEKAAMDTILASNGINWTNLGVKLTQLFDMNTISNGSPIIGRPLASDPNYAGPGLCRGTQTTAPTYTDPNWTGCPSKNPNGVAQSATTDPEHPRNYFARFSTQEWITALQSRGSLDADELKALQIIASGNQILRDRTLGFKTGVFLNSSSTNFNNSTGVWTNPTSGSDQVNAGQIDPGDTYKLGCDPSSFARGTSSGIGGSSGSSRARLGLAVALCSFDNSPKYPSLYYLFPVVNHSQVGAAASGSIPDHTQPVTTEEFFTENGATNKYIVTVNTSGAITSGKNSTVTYSAVQPADIDLTPRDITATTGGWRLPKTAVTGTFGGTDAEVLSELQANYIQVGTGFYQTTVLDKAMMDGRELMSVRVLDTDINMLRTNTNGAGGDEWLPEVDGVVYAFREDAAREDSIIRPFDSSFTDAAAAWTGCNEVSEITANACRMNVPEAQDPPLNSANKISTKPVDFFADPDRRPYGFRLINGARVDRGTSAQSGMTFISDNSVYIYGNFNLHSSNGTTTCTNLREEFTDKLDNNCDGTEDIAFYPANNATTGRVTANINSNFALPSADTWRPAEVFGDAVGILSANFRDGSIQDGFTRNRPTSRGLATVSYENQNTPNQTTLNDTSNTDGIAENYWVHEGSAVVNPVLVNRNGDIFRNTTPGTAFGAFYTFPTLSTNAGSYVSDRQNQNIGATSTYVNATFISGIVPSRAGQSYGGMHNFPRFNEFWAEIGTPTPVRKLYISGGFFQLNFSTSATAPFDQDVWEPSATAPWDTAIDVNGYYGSPPRIWGYDVGLQYAPAGPIARRFVTVGSPRSEFYRELPVDDPYIDMLRCAVNSAGNRVVDTANAC
jgi:hypothetical protein